MTCEEVLSEGRVRGANASRVLVGASRGDELPTPFGKTGIQCYRTQSLCRSDDPCASGSSSRRDAGTDTRDAHAPQR